MNHLEINGNVSGSSIQQGSPAPVVDLETVDFKALAQECGDQLVKYFAFSHLKPELKAVSQHFAAVAFALVRDVPRNPERTVALRKMLEAKDCAVRAALP